MRTRWTRIGLAAAGLAIGLALLALSLRGTPPGAIIAVLAAGDWRWPAATALAGTCAFVAAKVIRWHRLLGAPADLGVGALLKPVVAGLALNSMLPHSGELLRTVALERLHDRPAARVLTSIFVERLFDLFAVLLLGALAFVLAPTRQTQFATAFRVIGVVATVGATAVLCALLAPVAVMRFALAAPLPPRLHGRVAVLTAQLIDGMQPLGRLATALPILGWSLAQWLSIALCVYGCAEVAGVSVSLPAALLVVVGLVVAFLLPNAPGYVGATQAAFWAALAPLGVSVERALAASVAYQLLMILPLAVVGLGWARGTVRRVNVP